jgi:hypothetical protein
MHFGSADLTEGGTVVLQRLLESISPYVMLLLALLGDQGFGRPAECSIVVLASRR